MVSMGRKRWTILVVLQQGSSRVSRGGSWGVWRLALPVGVPLQLRARAPEHQPGLACRPSSGGLDKSRLASGAGAPPDRSPAAKPGRSWASTGGASDPRSQGVPPANDTRGSRAFENQFRDAPQLHQVCQT